MTLPVDGIKLHRGNFAAISQQIQPLLDAGQCFRLQVKPWREKRSLSQNALSHMWYRRERSVRRSSGRDVQVAGRSCAAGHQQCSAAQRNRRTCR